MSGMKAHGVEQMRTERKGGVLSGADVQMRR